MVERKRKNTKKKELFTVKNKSNQFGLLKLASLLCLAVIAFCIFPLSLSLILSLSGCAYMLFHFACTAELNIGETDTTSNQTYKHIKDNRIAIGNSTYTWRDGEKDINPSVELDHGNIPDKLHIA